MQKSSLILYSILLASERGKCDFEKLLKECFDLAPAEFCFAKYPQWPDARKLDRPLRKLRQKNLISGDPSTSFSLTKSGKRLAEGIAATFRQKPLFK